jgi:hypothetical protein
MESVVFLDKQNQPSQLDIMEALGQASDLWLELINYLQTNYDFSPELSFFTKKYGWTIRYRRKGKTICYLFPQINAFSVLLILGNKQAEQALKIQKDLTPDTLSIIINTPQLHDGRWMWFKISNQVHVEDIKLLLKIKQAPKTSSK